MTQVVAVTGGSRGIGLAIARLFRERRARVAVLSRSERPAAVSTEIFYQRGDVRDRGDMFGFAHAVTKKFKRLDAFINCAGMSRWRTVEDIDEAFMRDIYYTNVLGTMWGCAAASSVMKKRGAIVNVSSLAGKRGSANNSAYCASKFAVNGITQSLAKELGPKGIRVNAVCPVYVATDTILESLADRSAPPSGKPVKKYLADFARTQTALKRLPTEREVAEAVFFLSSAAASAITGQCINVDCGTLPQ